MVAPSKCVMLCVIKPISTKPMTNKDLNNKDLSVIASLGLKRIILACASGVVIKSLRYQKKRITKVTIHTKIEAGARLTIKSLKESKSSTPEKLVESTKLSIDQVRRGMEWLKLKGLADIQEIEKLELSTIPPDLRTILGRPKNYFKEQKDCFVLIDKSRNITIGWFQIQQIKENHFYVEPLISPGWTHLYEMLLNIILCQCIKKEEDFKLTVNVVDYITELSSILGKLGFLPVQAKELLVKTIWQRVKERKEKKAKLGVPFTAPT